MDICNDLVNDNDADTILRRANSSISEELEQQLEEAQKLMRKYLLTVDDPEALYNRITRILYALPVPKPPILPKLLTDHYQSVQGSRNSYDEIEQARKRKIAKYLEQDDRYFEKANKSIYRNEK